MTWLGKILALLVMVLAVVWMWFTVSVYVARTNWKVQADAYKKAYAEAKDAREAEYRTNLAEKDALIALLNSSRKEGEKLASQYAAAKDDTAKKTEELAALQKSLGSVQAQLIEIQAVASADRGRADNLQARLKTLETELIEKVVIAEQAVKDKQAAETQARQAVAARLVADQENEKLKGQVSDLRAGLTGGPVPLFGQRAAPVPEGSRGTVVSYSAAGFLEISLGLDHGVTNGAVLDVYRTGAAPKYLGTVTVDRAYPQRAFGSFTPADPRRSVGTLRDDEKPKAGDRVGRVGALAAGLAPAN